MDSGRSAHNASASGPLQLVDRAVSIFQQDPFLWMLAAWKPVLPLALSLLMFLHCHRVLWVDQQWSLSIQLGSLAVSALVLAACIVRALGHGPLYGAVIGVAHPRAMAQIQEQRCAQGYGQVRFALAGSALLVLGLGLVTGLFGVLPGLVVVAFMAPVTGLISLEGLSLSEALLRRLQFAPGILLRGLLATALLMVALGLCWINLVVGAQLLVVVLRMMTAVDVGVLSVWLSPFNVDFLVYMLLVAFLLLEPLWLILRALLYLDVHLSQSGMDLLERWQELVPAPSHPPRTERPIETSAGGALLILVVSLALVSLPSMALAEEPDSFQWPKSDLAPLPKGELIEALESKAEAVEEHIATFDEVGSVNLRSLRLVLLDRSLVPVQLRGSDPIQLDLQALTKGLPEIVHTTAQADRLRRLAQRLRESAQFVGWQYQLGQGTTADAAAGPAAADLLEEELTVGGYQLPDSSDEGRVYRASLRERLRGWWDDWAKDVQPSPGPEVAEFSRRDLVEWIFVLIALLFGGLIGAVLLKKSRSGRHHESRDAALASGSVPSTRVVPSFRDLRAEAQALADQHRYVEATRMLFLATLVELDRGREIDLRPERSNGEHVRGFRGSMLRRDLFRAAIRRFESHVYGKNSCSRADFEAMRVVVAELTAASTGDPDSASDAGRRSP